MPGIAPVCLFYGKMSWKIWFHVSRMRLPVPPASSSLARHPAVKAPARPIFVVSNIRLIAAAAWHMSFLLVIEHGGFRREARAAGQKTQNTQPIAFLCGKEIWLVALNASAYCGVYIGCGVTARKGGGIDIVPEYLYANSVPT